MCERGNQRETQRRGKKQRGSSEQEQVLLDRDKLSLTYSVCASVLDAFSLHLAPHNTTGSVRSLPFLLASEEVKKTHTHTDTVTLTQRGEDRARTAKCETLIDGLSVGERTAASLASASNALGEDILRSFFSSLFFFFFSFGGSSEGPQHADLTGRLGLPLLLRLLSSGIGADPCRLLIAIICMDGVV